MSTQKHLCHAWLRVIIVSLLLKGHEQMKQVNIIVPQTHAMVFTNTKARMACSRRDLTHRKCLLGPLGRAVVDFWQSTLVVQFLSPKIVDLKVKPCTRLCGKMSSLTQEILSSLLLQMVLSLLVTSHQDSGRLFKVSYIATNGKRSGARSDKTALKSFLDHSREHAFAPPQHVFGRF